MECGIRADRSTIQDNYIELRSSNGCCKNDGKVLGIESYGVDANFNVPRFQTM